ncbi:GT2 family glycosyltransferase [Leeuwenhoekiella aestuarii]|uniref:glycosyltransferase n=1 Tax=Leeuwenhoekiella aestuarii TaxID=2249426 RepID=UPI000FFEE6B8|nr:glycosyltransferase [Leeuwenhoekiella aestuarii]RXG12924.1 GT2 family glycosyltransferase [Leeuwenhoekiella aestuarii]
MSLAIVIPAYKIQFFEKALESISNQTCKDFKVYIGDDCSPYELKDLVQQFSNTIDIVYKRFEKNLGGQDLVAQWERCIDLVGDEEWVWLFSDDDIMSANCVENFYKILKQTDGQDYLYHFDINSIDEDGKVIRQLPLFPKTLSSLEFFKKRSSNELISFVVEFIFNKQSFLKAGRFQNFDLAWASDHATWIKLAKGSLIYTIPEALVYWRKSSLNISPNTKDIKMSLRKIQASSTYYLWVRNFLSEEMISDRYLIKSFLNNTKAYNGVVPWVDFKTNIKSFTSKVNSKLTGFAVCYMYVHRLFKRLKNSNALNN